MEHKCFIAALIVLLVSGCDFKKNYLQEKSESQIYHKALYSPVLTFDPVKLTDTGSQSVSNQIYEGLLEYGDHFEIRPALAESWETSRDGLSIKFKLRKGILFHDGTELTSMDCVASFTRLLGKDSIVSKYYSVIKGADEFTSGKSKTVVGLKAPDDFTFVIKLKNKFPPFPAVLAGSTARILPHRVVHTPKFFSTPIGTGPFQFLSADKSGVILKRFESYWREKANLERLEFVVMSETQGLEKAELGNIHDLVTFPLNGNESIFKSGQHLEIPVVATWFIGLNTRIEPFKDKRVRQAFKAAISPSEFVTQLYPSQIPATGYIPPGLPGHLDENDSRVAVSKTTSTVPIKLFIPSLLSKSQEIKSFLETRFKSAGFKVSIIPIGWDEMISGYNKKSMQAFLLSMNADYTDTEFLIGNFESSNPDNFSGFKSYEVDSLIEKARTEDSRSDRTTLYQKLAKIVNNEALTINLFHYKAHYWFSNCVGGIELNSLGDVYIPYRKVFLTKKCAVKPIEVANAKR